MLSSTGASKKVCVIGQPGPINIALAWHDYPGSANSALSLVNDLDLTVNVDVIAGAKFLGNGVVDRTNNVERVKSSTFCSFLVRKQISSIQVLISVLV